MKRSLLVAFSLLALAACNKKAPEAVAPMEPAAVEAPAAPAEAPAAPAVDATGDMAAPEHTEAH
ncbi:MAG: hypothetical protein A2527_08155 [Candidatus Lambdaproteobacteria bacterium RIFOXYD2_FULL_50_16]|uniref:Type IV secretion system putative lipoprotein virB7 n=1 Tax=Candidatus Lambdaproteobacteria bacterium RIFOXYD2_FULL_50_16 TaxID=1817772 RepID=A0A1F6GAL3_9PROT|nr:MAG: hypothetical protein A2527_08155 [Candidatus Lambdaproteobacteria bacterium RIFOXYD2_FULL_50_16]